ncbi:MAG TPA: sensor histidine kinase, partial [Acidimicrobiales bacterium]|nr:sensor histidine kinase [Acidimicrobiales bacterium]
VGLTAGLGAVDILFVMLLIAGTATSVFGVSRLIEANHALKRAQADEARIAVAEERLRFARDLHDLLGHSLSVITLKSEVASRLMAADARRATQEVGEIHQIARQALREVREAVNGYRQATIAIELAGARTALAAAGIRWHEEIDSVELPEDSEAVLAWALREGVTNVVRHARATSCAVTLVADEDEVTATVSDDGRADGPVTFGNGLGGLGERVAAVGGTFSAGPRPGGGFRLRVTVPRCPAAAAAAGRAPSASAPSAGPDASGGPMAPNGVPAGAAGSAGSAPGSAPADRLAPLAARRPEPELGPLRGA